MFCIQTSINHRAKIIVFSPLDRKYNFSATTAIETISRNAAFFVSIKLVIIKQA